MKNQTATSRKASRVSGAASQGFSLVELLSCLAIIGIIAAMALPSLAGIIDSTVSTKARHQVQTLTQTYAAAQLAGAVFAEPTCEGVVEALTRPEGVRGRGIFAKMTFRVSMTPEEKAAVIQSGMVVSKTLPDGTLVLESRLERAL